MLRNAIQGTWELVSYIAQDNHGGPITYPLGPDALDLIMYTADGYMSAQLMRRDRPAFDRPELDGGTAEQTAAAAAGYLDYSGHSKWRNPPASCITMSGCRYYPTGSTELSYGRASSTETTSRYPR
jgi:hypothetical protein